MKIQIKRSGFINRDALSFYKIDLIKQLRIVMLTISFFVMFFLTSAQNLTLKDPLLPNAPVVKETLGLSRTASSLSLAVVAPAVNLASDSLALVDLYNATNGPLWTSKT